MYTPFVHASVDLSYFIHKRVCLSTESLLTKDKSTLAWTYLFAFVKFVIF